MKANILALGLFGLAGASAVLPRAYPTNPAADYPVSEEDYEDGYKYKNQKGGTSTWKPKSKSPEFFNLRVDEKCDVTGDVPEAPADCPFNGYAIRLEGGIFIATPYNKWWDPKLPTFFVDDDTQLYTVCDISIPWHVLH
jgi:hypothetical protein